MCFIERDERKSGSWLTSDLSQTFAGVETACTSSPERKPFCVVSGGPHLCPFRSVLWWSWPIQFDFRSWIEFRLSQLEPPRSPCYRLETDAWANQNQWGAPACKTSAAAAFWMRKLLPAIFPSCEAPWHPRPKPATSRRLGILTGD